jgi:hypothetical protein
VCFLYHPQVLVGFAVLIRPGSLLQIISAFIIVLVYMLLIGIAQPFKDVGDDIFAKACNFSLSALFFFSVVLKVGVLTEEVDSLINEQLRSRFEFDAVLVSTGMIVSTIGALVVAAVMAVSQIIEAARKPLLKLKSTKSVPALPMQSGHKWHMFLSHIWSSGQDQCATIKRQLTLLMPESSIFLDVSGDGTQPGMQPQACRPCAHPAAPVSLSAGG